MSGRRGSSSRGSQRSSSRSSERTTSQSGRMPGVYIGADSHRVAQLLGDVQPQARERPSSSAQPLGRGSGPRCIQQLFTDSHPPEVPEVHQVRMPDMHPVPTTSPAPSDADSTPGVTSELPSQLYLPHLIPAIPEVTETGLPIWPLQRQYLTAEQVYQYEPFEHPELLRPARHARKQTTTTTDSASSSGAEKNTRGVVNYDALRRQANASGRFVIDEPDGATINPDNSRHYSGFVGGLIRDKVPMLWERWSHVPDEVKGELNNAASAVFDIADHRRAWADSVQRERYKDWKNELRDFWRQHGNDRMGTPKEFQFREYEWRWLKTVDFNNPRSQERSRQNSENRRKNTTPHHAGSAPFSKHQQRALLEEPTENPFVTTFKKLYRSSPDHIERVERARDKVMRDVVLETQPDISEDELPTAMTQIDQTDPRINARIFGSAFSNRTNHHWCRGMGDTGVGILKTTPGFQKKGVGSSSQLKADMVRMQRASEARESRMEREIRRLAERSRRRDEHHRALVAWYMECQQRQQSHSALQNQWMYEVGMACAEHRQPPQPPDRLELPARPPSPVFTDSDDEQQDAPPQDGYQPDRDQQDGDDDADMDLGIDFSVV